MQITIQFWGVAARLAGQTQRPLDVPEPATVGTAIDLLAQDAALAAELPRCAYAVGTELVGRDHALKAGDELAVLPPVSGG